MNGDAASAPPIVIVVDVANVMGSRPDGWWRDRAGAATTLLAGLPTLIGREVSTTDGERVRVARIIAVVEGAAKSATGPAGIDLVRAPTDGDSAIVGEAMRVSSAGERVVVVTADRGLRARLADGVLAIGPGWLNALLGRQGPGHLPPCG